MQAPSAAKKRRIPILSRWWRVIVIMLVTFISAVILPDPGMDYIEGGFEYAFQGLLLAFIGFDHLAEGRGKHAGLTLMTSMGYILMFIPFSFTQDYTSYADVVALLTLWRFLLVIATPAVLLWALLDAVRDNIP